MGLQFDCPMGPGADVKEIEYCTTLLQTNVEEIRQDGSLQIDDIELFLSSRYGIQNLMSSAEFKHLLSTFSTRKMKNVSERTTTANNDAGEFPSEAAATTTTKTSIMPAASTSDPTALDVMEFVALLLIPSLRNLYTNDYVEGGGEEAGDKNNNKLSEYMNVVVKMTLYDALGRDENKANNGKRREEEEEVELTASLLKKIWISLGEYELANDQQLLQQMVDAASTSPTAATSTSTKNQKRNHQKVRVQWDTDSLTRGLLHDIEEYDPKFVLQWQTNVDDVCGGTKPNNNKNGASSSQPTPSSTNHLDQAADQYRSRILVFCQWAHFTISYFTYYSGIGTFVPLFECPNFDISSASSTWLENYGPFFCFVVWSVGRWTFIVATMFVYGLIYFGLTGYGNNGNEIVPTTTTTTTIRIVKSALATMVAGVFTFGPLFVDKFDRGDGFNDLFLKALSTFLGIMVILFNSWSVIGTTIQGCDSSQFYKYLFMPGSVRLEAMIKRAGMKKTNQLITNALQLHQSPTRQQEERHQKSGISSRLGQVLLNYSETSQNQRSKTKRVGGIRWTWHKIWNEEIFRDDGIWFSGRLMSINFTQFLLAIFILIGGIYLTITATEQYQPPSTTIEALFDNIFELSPSLQNIQEISWEFSSQIATFLVEDTPSDSFDCPEPVNIETCAIDNLEGCRNGGSWLCATVGYTAATAESGAKSSRAIQEALLNMSGLPISNLYDSTNATLAIQTGQTVATLYPTEKYMIFFPLFLGIFAAFCVALTVALTVVPSIASTTFRLRYGLIDLMSDPKQKAIRIAPDQVAYLRGQMFWGNLTSSLLMGVIVGGITFFLLWQVTAVVAHKAFAAVIGILVVILFHWIGVRSCRSITSQAFYRKRPVSANLILLARECAFFALTVGFTLIRVAKLIFVTIIFVGRVDIPILAPGVGEIEAVGYKLDNTPYVFLMDILQHEAHRHPYIEMFGVICLLKLKHGDKFISRAGSAWRLLFVSSLMPWLAIYRRLARSRSSTMIEEDILSHPILTNTTEENESQDDKVVIEDLQRQVRLLREQLALSTKGLTMIKRPSDGMSSMAQEPRSRIVEGGEF